MGKSAWLHWGASEVARWRGWSIRAKVYAVLAVAALLPALLVSALGLVSVLGLADMARRQASEAVRGEARARLLTRAEEMARADDALFERALGQARTLAQYFALLYEHPDYFRNPQGQNWLPGGSPLVMTPEGHMVNSPDTPVGVFVSRQARAGPALWEENGWISWGDPLLEAVKGGSPTSRQPVRTWMITATGIARIYPNQRLGQKDSPVGPDYDMTRDEPFQAAGPNRNPARAPVWTAPYLDPAGGGRLLTAAVPIYSADGRFLAVAGVDLSLRDVEDALLGAQAGPGSYAFVFDPREGTVISAPQAAYTDLGAELPAAGPGRRSAAPLTGPLAQELRQANGSGVYAFTAAGGARFAGYAPLTSTGWLLVFVAPAAEVEAPVAAVRAGIAESQALFFGGALAALGAIAALAAWGAARAAGALARPMQVLVAGTGNLAADLSYRLPDLGQDELGRVASAFNAMAESLESSRAAAVRSAEAAAEAVVNERTRLAREIHDTTAQGLTGVVVQLENLEDVLGPALPDEARRHLDRARGLARESLREARRSVWNLRPRPLEAGGLAGALRELAGTLEADGIGVALDLPPAALPLAAGAEEALYRVAQEALSNVRRHSGAKKVRIRLAGIAGGGAELQVWDDGRGFDAAGAKGPRPEGGFGLWGMAGRLQAAGGTLQVQSAPGMGTVVTGRVGGQASGTGH